MRDYPCYLRIEEESGFVFSSGVNFATFWAGIPYKPSNLLLLKGAPQNAQYHRKIGLEYILEKDLPSFLQEDVYQYGDFSWINFAEATSLETLSDENLAELLFAAHTCRPIHHYLWEQMHNQYLYLCHDDDYWVKIYMNRLTDYKPVLEAKIRLELMGRKRFMAPIPDEILDTLYNFFISGGVFDFENALVSATFSGVRIFPLKDMGFDPDEIHRGLDHQRKIAGVGYYLEYHPKTKKWFLL